MAEVTRLYYLAATADVGPATGGTIHSVLLTPAGAEATITLKDGAGATLGTVKAPANGASVQVAFQGAAYDGQLSATLAGAGAVATVEL